MDPGFVIRDAVPSDLEVVSGFAGKLVRFHRDLDPARYMHAENVEEGYRRWFTSELKRKDRVVLIVAERRADQRLVGYAYGRLEDRDWNALLDAHGALHDVWVEPEARRAGVASALVERTCTLLEERGAPRILLHTAWQNTSAHAVFERAGFRKTMIEMTREKGG